MNTIILWGAGAHSAHMLSNYYFPLKLIEGVIDRDLNKKGRTFFGKTILAPDEIDTLKSGLIVIGTDKYFDDVKDYIESLRLEKEIISLDEYMQNYAGRKEDISLFQYDNENMKLLDERLKMTGGIPAENMRNARVLASRFEAIDLMPKNMIAAEIGVAYGDF